MTDLPQLAPLFIGEVPEHITLDGIIRDIESHPGTVERTLNGVDIQSVHVHLLEVLVTETQRQGLPLIIYVDDPKQGCQTAFDSGEDEPFFAFTASGVTYSPNISGTGWVRER